MGTKGNSSNDFIGRYIDRPSSVVLLIVKILEALPAGYLLYRLGSIAVSFMIEIIKGTVRFNEVVNTFCKEFTIDFVAITETNTLQFQGINNENVILGLLYFAFLLSFLVIPLLNIIESIALISLKTVRKAAKAVKRVHWIHLFFTLLYIIFSAYNSFIISKNRSEIEQMLETADPRNRAYIKGFIIAVIVITIIILVTLFLFSCYHRDIVKVMGAVDMEIINNKIEPLKKTHLSGLAVLFGVFVLFIAFVMTIAYRNSGVKFDFSNMTRLRSDLIVILLMYINAAKFFAVNACYGNFKKVNGGL
ncbi:MAG: hypothetical protein IKN57_05650 [Parasporobacterium sp.]|nr:hypothetical protein [Parasporobacterium sp.]